MDERSISTLSPRVAEISGGGYVVQPPLESAKLSRFHRVPHTSHSRYFPWTMWKLKEPQGSQTLIPVNIFPEGDWNVIKGK